MQIILYFIKASPVRFIVFLAGFILSIGVHLSTENPLVYFYIMSASVALIAFLTACHNSSVK